MVNLTFSILSIASIIRLASSVSNRTFTDEQEATLEAFVTDNSGQYTYAEIADSFEDGHFSAKSIQGKILSMELTSHVKPAEKQESVRTYSPEEEATFISMVNEAEGFARKNRFYVEFTPPGGLIKEITRNNIFRGNTVGQDDEVQGFTPSQHITQTYSVHGRRIQAFANEVSIPDRKML